MTVRELKEKLEKIPDDLRVFINPESDCHPDFDEPCTCVFHDLDAGVIVLRSI